MKTLKAYFSIALLLILALFSAARPASAMSCACYDSSTGEAVGPIFDAPGGVCNPACDTSCAANCALCKPDGGVDCSGSPGQPGGGPFSIGALFSNITSGLNTIIVFLFLIATVLMLIGILQYITAGGDEEKVKRARALILYGVLGLGVMITVWAFVAVVIDFFFHSGTDITIPASNIVRPL